MLLQDIKNFPIASAFILTFSLTFLLVPSLEARVNAIIPFGGPVSRVWYCNCSANLQITIGPPTPGFYQYQPGGTIVFPYGQIYKSGSETLGNLTPPGICLNIIVTGCITFTPSSATITMVGTSQ